jgi:hypothetical protein
MTDEARLARRLQALMDGYLATQVLYAAGVAEGPLRRILRVPGQRCRPGLLDYRSRQHLTGSTARCFRP